ncbi:MULTISPECIES: V-type ATP synthase subunit E [unclassified Jeotgalibaca]|uniref:V-type ATP synthase subunit E n=1 Tax=unclassified Jeotgalibaca TaxID=2621505 RepID=UPI003FD16326
MKELETLANQILDRTKAEGQQKIAAKEKELNEKLEENRLRFVDYQKNQKASILSRSHAEYERQSQSLRNEKRNVLLGEKQAIMTKIYAGAVERMTEWDTLTFQNFASNVLKQFEGQAIKVTAGEKSVAHFTDAFLKKYPTVTYSQETVPAKAGFIVEVGGIDYNYFFDQMVTEIKKDFTPKLASLAFQTNE